MHKAKSTADFISQHPEWQEILIALRQILRETELDESIKWGVPVYTINDKNVVGLTAFKQHVALWFFQARSRLYDHFGRIWSPVVRRCQSCVAELRDYFLIEDASQPL